ncbi:MAG: TrkA family potassium uptake protein [Desulfobacterales bacterium]|nr:TrkA family potassium uptake protein [Desulfobacterales bacterium]
MKQFAVIGLGNFGYYLATHLYAKGHEVLAIDIDPNRVQEIKDRVTRAVIADTTDQKVIKALGFEHMDSAVVCIGSILSASILTTLVLKDLGVNRVLAKAVTENHGRILLKVGASEIFFPEKDLAVSMAERLDNPNIIDYLPFLEGYSIIELAPSKKLIGKSLKELDLINSFGVQVVAIKETIADNLNMVPTGKFILKDSDIMILLGSNAGLEKLKKYISE